MIARNERPAAAREHCGYCGHSLDSDRPPIERFGVGGLPTSTVNGFAVNPTNPKVMYVAMRDGIFRSENAGETWTRAQAAPTNVAAVAVDPKKPSEVYAATAAGRIFRSPDGGLRWDESR